MSIPLEWIDRLDAAPGTILVERDERPDMFGTHIIIPESVRTSKRSALATVVASGCPGVEPGDRVMLAVGVGRKIEFGVRGERALYSARPTELLLKVSAGEAEHAGGPIPDPRRFQEDRSRFHEANKEEGWQSG